MLKRTFLKLAVCSIAIVPLAACVNTGSDASFSSFAGVWSGQQVRDNGTTRPMVVTIAENGTYSWVSNGDLVTDGRLTARDGQVLYTNEAGSRGVVTAAANTLVFENRFTGDNYAVTVTR